MNNPFRVVSDGWSLVLAWWGIAAIVSAQEGPRFTNCHRLANQEISLQLTANKGQTFRLEASTNLPDWQPFLTATSTGVIAHVDTAAPYLGARFYRASQLTGVNIVTGDGQATTNGDLVIHPVYHASLALGWGARMIYVDPANSSYAGLPLADLVLFTHNHGDHFVSGSTPALLESNAIILAPQLVYNGMTAALKSRTTVMVSGMVTNWQGASIEALPMYNLANTPHIKGDGIGYVLTLGGARVYIAGDSQNTAEMLALTAIDVAFLPINQPYTMTIAQAVSATRAFRPRVVYPCHYRNQDGSYTDLAAFKQQVGQDLGIEVRIRKWY